MTILCAFLGFLVIYVVGVVLFTVLRWWDEEHRGGRR